MEVKSSMIMECPAYTHTKRKNCNFKGQIASSYLPLHRTTTCNPQEDCWYHYSLIWAYSASPGSVYLSKCFLGLQGWHKLAPLDCVCHVIRLFGFYCFFSSWMRGSKEGSILERERICLPVWPVPVEILIWLWKWHMWPLLWIAVRLAAWMVKVSPAGR